MTQTTHTNYTYAKVIYVVVNDKYFERLKMREINRWLERLA